MTVLVNYLLVFNISKQNNVDALLRCASAFAFTPLLILSSKGREGREHVWEENRGGGSLRVLCFTSLSFCLNWLKERNVAVIGIEIDERAVPLHAFAWPETTSSSLPSSLSSSLEIEEEEEEEEEAKGPQTGRGGRGRRALLPLLRSIALVPGNEGSGLSARLRSSCEQLLYIPQYGNGTASLNVHVAASLVMHRLARLLTASEE